MATGTLLVRLADGARVPFAREALVNLFDGAQRRVHASFHPRPNIEFTIPVTDGPNDIYAVVVSAKDHVDAGQVGIPVKADVVSIVDLMLIPRRAKPVFRPLAQLDAIHPRLRPLIEGFLNRTLNSASEPSYQRLQATNPAGLMTFFSIASAFADLAGPDHPLDFVEMLLDLKPDRFFAAVRDSMPAILNEHRSIFKDAPSLLHPGAFVSYKETRYMEGNVQFTFAKSDSGLLTVDGDIDLFADPAAHLLLEVLPNDVFNPPSVTDARRAYALRWMSVQRKRAVDTASAAFEPPFALVAT